MCGLVCEDEKWANLDVSCKDVWSSFEIRHYEGSWESQPRAPHEKCEKEGRKAPFIRRGTFIPSLTTIDAFSSTAGLQGQDTTMHLAIRQAPAYISDLKLPKCL